MTNVSVKSLGFWRYKCNHILHRIMVGFHGAFATGMPVGDAYPSGHLVSSPFWDLLVLQLLRPDSSILSCLYLTFHL